MVIDGTPFFSCDHRFLSLQPEGQPTHARCMLCKLVRLASKVLHTPEPRTGITFIVFPSDRQIG